MNKWTRCLSAAVLLALFVSLACNNIHLTEADTVTPQLASPLRWTAGQTGALEVHLLAQQENGPRRVLSFVDADPVATIVFFKGEEPLSPPATVTLSHRCCGGKYSAPGAGVTVPADATRANVVVTWTPSVSGPKTVPLEKTIAIQY